MLANRSLVWQTGAPELGFDLASTLASKEHQSMIGKVTKTTVEKLPLNSVLWDTALVGFGARRQRRHVHYLLRYRLNGRQRFQTIGKHGSPWTADQARNEARRLLGLVATRVDPASERVRPAETFGAEVERYLESKRPALKSRTNHRGQSASARLR